MSTSIAQLGSCDKGIRKMASNFTSIMLLLALPAAGAMALYSFVETEILNSKSDTMMVDRVHENIAQRPLNLNIKELEIPQNRQVQIILWSELVNFVGVSEKEIYGIILGGCANASEADIAALKAVSAANPRLALLAECTPGKVSFVDPKSGLPEKSLPILTLRGADCAPAHLTPVDLNCKEPADPRTAANLQLARIAAGQAWWSSRLTLERDWIADEVIPLITRQEKTRPSS